SGLAVDAAAGRAAVLRRRQRQRLVQGQYRPAAAALFGAAAGRDTGVRRQGRSGPAGPALGPDAPARQWVDQHGRPHPRGGAGGELTATAASLPIARDRAHDEASHTVWSGLMTALTKRAPSFFNP